MKSTPEQREALREVAVGREGPLGEALLAVLDDLEAAECELAELRPSPLEDAMARYQPAREYRRKEGD